MRPFYLCEDPEVIMPKQIEAHIYSYKKPRFFAMLEKIDPSKPLTDISYIGANLVFSYKTEKDETMGTYILAVNDNIDGQKYDKVGNTLQKMADWYVRTRAIRTGSKEVGVSFLDNMLPELAYIKLLYFESKDEYLLSYGIGVKGFKTYDEVEAFMIGTLKLPASMFKQDVLINGEV